MGGTAEDEGAPAGAAAESAAAPRRPRARRTTAQPEIPADSATPAVPRRAPTKARAKAATEPAAAAAPDGGAALAAPSMERWLAPTRTSTIDQIELGVIDDGWTPARVGELPLTATVAAIRAVGVVEPVLLRPLDGGRFEVVTGHRSVAGAREAGLSRIPAVVRVMDDAAALMAMVFDGTATGRLTPAAAGELRARMLAAGLDEESVEDAMFAVAVEVAVEVAEPEAVAEEAVAEEVVAEEAVAEVEAVETAAAVATEPVLEEVLAATVAEERTLEEVAPVAAEAALEAPAAPAALEPVAVPAPPAARPLQRVPLPAGRPRFATLSSAFTDVPRLLAMLASEGFSGTVEIDGSDGRLDLLVFVEGRCHAALAEQDGQALDVPPRLPAPGAEPIAKVTVTPHPRGVAAALSLAVATPPRLSRLHGAFTHLPGLLSVLARERAQAACIVTAPGGRGVILVSDGQPVAAYVRRPGGDDQDDVASVTALLGTTGELDVHSGPLPAPVNIGSR